MTLITVSFPINFRERAYPLPEKHLIVSIIEEFSDSLNYMRKAHPRFQKDRVLSAEVNLPRSLEVIDKKVSGMEEENRDEKVPHDVKVEVSFSEPKIKTDGSNDIFSDINLASSLSHGTWAESQRSSSLNNQKRDFRNTDLLSAIRSSIEKAKTYPLIARKRGIEGTVLVSFRINGKGLPQDVKIVNSSGYQILDEEVPKMLRKASPFPELNGEIVIPITFKLSDSISNR
jgi:TonB family protein